MHDGRKGIFKPDLRDHLRIFIKNLFNDKSFKIKVGTRILDPFKQETGTHQGNILSLTLFSVKIYSLLNCVKDIPLCS